ncbi:DUF3307 domain-containing protein [Marinifilum sp.]|uniref:DUF3307 domain-containing protein n=1 Tax=Marinifilum sp. TaxID=2033137 RepID=UPI003BAD471E
MDYSILVRLVLAHLLSDFVFQPTSWAEEKENKGFKSKYLYLHTLITGIFAWCLIWDQSWLIPILIITAIHLVTDGIKGEVNKIVNGGSYPGPGYLFVIDQLIHFSTIIIAWLIVSGQAIPLCEEICDLIKGEKLWYILLGYTAISIPTSVVIGKMTQKWNQELNGPNNSVGGNRTQPTNGQNNSSGTQTQSANGPNNPSQGQAQTTNGTQGLENAGKWIGIVERIMILTFVLINQFAAIGFMLAAKSVLRFGDLKDGNDQKKTEYIIIGTFLSFMLSIFTGIVIKYLIK